MLQLVTFGNLSLTQDGKGVVPLPQKALVVLAYMRAEEQVQLPRDYLARLLWGGEQTSAQVNFRKMIERVRKCASDGWLVPLEFSPTDAHLLDIPVTGDADVFSSMQDPLSRLGVISKLMTRQFFDDAAASVALKLWIEKQRDAYWQVFREVLFEAPASISDRKDWSVVKESARQLLERSPGDPSLREILLEAHRKAGHGDSIPAGYALARDLAAASPAAAAPSPILPIQAATELPRLVLLPPSETDGHYSSLGRALLEDITISLCALKTVAVVAPYTAARIRAHADKVAQLDAHSISYVIDTSISGEGLYVQMIFLPSDSVLWAERFQLETNFLAAHRKQVAEMIVAAIGSHLLKTERKLADYRAHPEVYRSYLASAQHLNKYTLPDIRRARKAFRETLKMRNDFAPALAGLSRTYSWEWVLTARGEKPLLIRAEEIAKKAIEQEPDLASAHRELGLSRLYIGDVDGSLEAFDQAEALSPHLADAICGYADALVHASRPADGLEKIGKAISLNPLCPDDYYWIAAGASYFIERYEDAIGYITQMADSSSAQRLLAASYAMAGDNSRARLHRRKALELNPYFDVEQWLDVLPVREKWQKDLYRDGLLKAGF